MLSLLRLNVGDRGLAGDVGLLVRLLLVVAVAAVLVVQAVARSGTDREHQTQDLRGQSAQHDRGQDLHGCGHEHRGAEGAAFSRDMHELGAQREENKHHNVAEHRDAQCHLRNVFVVAMHLCDHGDGAGGAPGRHQGGGQQADGELRHGRRLHLQTRDVEKARALQKEQADCHKAHCAKRDGQHLQAHLTQDRPELRQENLGAGRAPDERQRHLIDELAEQRDIRVRDQIRTIGSDGDADAQEAADLRAHAARELWEEAPERVRRTGRHAEGDQGIRVVPEAVAQQAGHDLDFDQAVARQELGVCSPKDLHFHTVGPADDVQGQVDGLRHRERLTRAQGFALAC
mmetsp:Transcript_100011/g.320813  ORF Transcript_100011/g.320813 Transcript_100011/m.320813 type:complete len:344 (+) Transcript_100011:1079-2110(+)